MPKKHRPSGTTNASYIVKKIYQLFPGIEEKRQAIEMLYCTKKRRASWLARKLIKEAMVLDLLE